MAKGITEKLVIYVLYVCVSQVDFESILLL